MHVIDASNPDWPRQRASVETILAELGLATKPTLLVSNKIDKARRGGARRASVRTRSPVSATANDGIDRLRAAIASCDRAMTGCARARRRSCWSRRARERRPRPTNRYTQLYRQLHPSVALLTMQIPADDPKRKGQWDDAYGSGVVIASGDWGSRLLTAAHVVADARNLRAVVGDAGKTVSGARFSRAATTTTISRCSRSTRATSPPCGSPPTGISSPAVPSACSAIRSPTRSATSASARRSRSTRGGSRACATARSRSTSRSSRASPGGPVFAIDTGDVIGLAESRFDEEHAIGFATPVAVIKRFLGAHPLPSPSP